MFSIYLLPERKSLPEISINTRNIYRDVSTGATGATEVAPKFSDTLTLSPPGGGQILPTIAEVASKFSLWLRPCSVWKSSLNFEFRFSSMESLFFFKFSAPFKDRLFSPKKVGSTNYLAGVLLCH